MRYLALGDSISIDNYTGVKGGGAASQLAALLPADEFLNLTGDGYTTGAVLVSLEQELPRPDLITLTAGGNDFLIQRAPEQILQAREFIARKLAAFNCPVIWNTIYDPTDGDDGLGEEMGLPPETRAGYNQLNDGIRALARQHRFLLCDLEHLFHGHGLASGDCWYVSLIEPGYAGATAIARRWHELASQAAV